MSPNQSKEKKGSKEGKERKRKRKEEKRKEDKRGRIGKERPKPVANRNCVESDVSMEAKCLLKVASALAVLYDP